MEVLNEQNKLGLRETLQTIVKISRRRFEDGFMALKFFCIAVVVLSVPNARMTCFLTGTWEK